MNTPSNNHWPWDVLGIESNSDERAVRRAYARLLKQQRPDEDAEAFQRLRYAYESALQMASGAPANGFAAAPDQPNGDGAKAAELIESTPDPATAPAMRPVTANAAEVEVAHEPDAFDTAVQLWQNFVARADDLESRRSLQDLFAAVVNIPTRDELEWQALCHCLNEDTPAALRMNLSAVLGWRDNAAHLRRRNAAIAALALDRVFADEDYDALRLRFAHAMALLEGPMPRMTVAARALLRAGARAEMEQLLIALGRYHPNVVRLRLDAEKADFWGRCLKFRIGVGRLFGPALALNGWCGLLFADASLNPNRGRWFDEWSPAQLGILLGTLMLALVAIAATTVVLSEPHQQKLRALRAIGWLRYGWVPMWLGATAIALCDNGSGSSTSIATAMLGACTIWAALVHGWPPSKELAILAAVSATALGFAGHWIATDSHAWLMPYAHGVLFAFFISFSQSEWREWVARRPRVYWACAPLWFAGFAALIVLLVQREARATQFAWALFAVMSAAGGVLATTRWNDLRGAIPAFFRGYANLAWMALAIYKPDIVACVCAGLMSVWVIEGGRRRGG
ncbi:J domain-containing protein [Paraburkholderia aromaticivorans]|uniref:Molecular chaperone DnaJ n=1 Tax=Paraburkholderia aromaticivorans TaxID=2026199 RepID=A0A248VSN6_9BURK|nr:J domain-containing protein [Paraburkholderia aromaticivorans]ASW02031.1 molecular chaperone DnaJ [Paraburkholderia aromaticivorans]